jgi:8-oxo-dGTP diphosphatase
MSTSKNNIQFAVLAVDAVCLRVINNTLCVLLGKTADTSPFPGKWALVGGLVHPEETAEEALSRHLLHKAGIKKIYSEQLYTFSEIDRDPRGRVVSVAYLALTGEDPQKSESAHSETKWQPVDALPHLAYDHAKIIAAGLDRLKGKIVYTNIAQHLLPSEFTFSELQSVYEIVLGKGLDKRNFRKKILACNILEETGATRKEGVMRPAALYRFTTRKLVNVELI